MVDYSIQNKKAWEYDAYAFWVQQSGTPRERARRDREDPLGMLKRYGGYFDTYEDDENLPGEFTLIAVRE